MSTRYASYVDAAKARATGAIDVWTTAYVTDGGTWIIASSPNSTDSGRPRDLVAVLPAAIEGSRVVMLWPTVHPDLIATLRSGLDSGGPS